LDEQDEFKKVFGKHSVLLSPNPTSVDGSTTAKLLLDSPISIVVVLKPHKLTPNKNKSLKTKFRFFLK